MRQLTTPKQIANLSPTARQRLEKWLEEKDYGSTQDGEFFPIVQLSIGNLIEFLNDNKMYVKCDQWIDDEWHHWRVGINWVEDKYEYLVEKEELVDALFWTVKQVLEQKN